MSNIRYGIAESPFSSLKTERQSLSLEPWPKMAGRDNVGSPWQSVFETRGLKVRYPAAAILALPYGSLREVISNAPDLDECPLQTQMVQMAIIHKPSCLNRHKISTRSSVLSPEYHREAPSLHLGAPGTRRGLRGAPPAPARPCIAASRAAGGAWHMLHLARR
jgi:hypothetical protein